MKTSVLITAIFIALGLSVQPQTKKVPLAKPVIKILAKADSVVSDSLLPDTVIALKKEVEQLGKELDRLNAQSKQKLKTEAKLNVELRNQGAALTRLANSGTNVDTLPRPKLSSPGIAPPDSVKPVVGQSKRNWFDRILHWRK